MSRKDFQMLADFMVYTRPYFKTDDLFNHAISVLANLLGPTNDRFDRAKFLAACCDYELGTGD